MLRAAGGLVLAGLCLVACQPGVPYASLHDVPGLAQWHATYQWRNTQSNGGCEDGNDCRAYGVLTPPRGDLPSAMHTLISQLRQHGWVCAASHSPRQAALVKDGGQWLVEFEPVADLIAESKEGSAYFDDAHGELAAAGRAAGSRMPAIAIEVTHTTIRQHFDHQESLNGLCR